MSFLEKSQILKFPRKQVMVFETPASLTIKLYSPKTMYYWLIVLHYI